MITVHDKHTEQNGFDNCGLRILNPVSAYVTEELNGRYDYEITCPCIPEDDSWQYLKEYNIIKSSKGQLFMIYKTVITSQNGVPYITAYANHIWYYLSDMLTVKAEGTRALLFALGDLFTEYNRDTYEGTTLFSHGTGLTDYNFDYSTDFSAGTDEMKHYKFEICSLSYAILGGADSIVNLWKAELHRDNFHFSINRRKEGYQDNAFWLKYGENCQNIKYTHDLSNRCTETWGWKNGNLGDYFAVSLVPDAGEFPHQVCIGRHFSYPAGSDDEVFKQDVSAYFTSNTGSKDSYDIQFVDGKGTNMQSEWEIFGNLRVGDSGKVTDILGNTSDQKIIMTKYNDITGRNEQVKLGDFIHSGLHTNRWDKILSSEDANSRRLDRLEAQGGYFNLITD